MASAPKKYAGDILPKEAWDFLSGQKDSVMIDVRTKAEWDFVGVPDLTDINKDIATISWRLYPDMNVNNGFENKVSEITYGNKNIPLIFLCRTGSRSAEAAAAMTTKGYSKCYNIVGGFEGDLDSFSHRGHISGWKASNLPWRQF